VIPIFDFKARRDFVVACLSKLKSRFQFRLAQLKQWEYSGKTKKPQRTLMILWDKEPRDGLTFSSSGIAVTHSESAHQK
jgi:hypothetical protein